MDPSHGFRAMDPSHGPEPWTRAMESEPWCPIYGPEQWTRVVGGGWRRLARWQAEAPLHGSLARRDGDDGRQRLLTAALLPLAFMISVVVVPNARYRNLMICCFWAHQFHATHWKAIVKNVKPRSHWEPDSRKIPLKLISQSPLPV